VVRETAVISKNIDFQRINKKFPHIGTKIFYLWTTDGLSPYLNDVLTNRRGGERQGFPADIAMAIFRLQQEHDSLYPTVTRQIDRSPIAYNADRDPGARFSDRSTVMW
jgi:hypothetical protein